MIGERLAWFRVASHLRIPVAELKARLTYSEFLDWLVYLPIEERRYEKQDFYLAQVAAEIRRANVKNPRSVKMRDFLLNYDKAASSSTGEGSKSVWLAATGVKQNKRRVNA